MNRRLAAASAAAIADKDDAVRAAVRAAVRYDFAQLEVARGKKV
jgi:hypothetical protein